MDGIAQEANTQLVNEFNSQFFFDLPTDLRYQSVEHFKYSPQSALSNNGDIRFYFPPRTGAAVYFLKDIILEVKVNLQNADGSKIGASKDVSVVNNTAHSLIKRLSVKVGDVSIVNTDNDFYFYKAYIKQLLGLSNNVKMAQIGIGADNFSTDTAGKFEEMTTKNLGFEARRTAFAATTMAANVATYTYYGDDVTYVARLQHDLVSCDVPLIPGVEVNIEMSLNKDSFLVKTSEASASYKLKVKEMYLHVPIGILSASLYNSLEASIRSTPVLMHYTRTSISVLEIPTNSLNFTAETVFHRTQTPSKIVIGFVDTEAFNGSYSKNGYNFRRSWTGESSFSQRQHETTSQRQNPVSNPISDDDGSDVEVLNAEERLNELRSELTNISGSNQRRNSLSGSIQRFLGLNQSSQRNNVNIESLIQRIHELEDLLGNIRARRRTPPPPTPPQPTPVPENDLRDDTITNFVKGTMLTFNGHPIDSLTQSSATEREDAINFYRFNYFLNFTDSLLSNSISYKDFMNGNFFCVYDLSTCSKSNVGFLVPSIRLGDLKFVVEFNKPLKHKVTMVIYQEHPALLTINHDRKVSLSYTKT